MDRLLLIGDRLEDDEPLQRFMAREGYELVQVGDRAAALRALDGDLLCALVDDDLPGDSGLAVLKALREACPTCEVILVTRGGEMDTAIEVLRAGALDYLRRPINTEELRVALGRARERRPHRRAEEAPVVLVLEDHEPTLKRTTEVLRKEGYRVLSAADGVAGLELFHHTRVDLILADMRMPGMGGLEVLRETKAKGADVEVIMITGYGDESSVIEALRGGAINFLNKPVDIDQMLLAIEKALEFQRARRSLAYRDRDVELMQLVVRLTKDLELIVETPQGISPAARQYLGQLIDALPLGVAVVDADRTVRFANRKIVEVIGEAPPRLDIEWVSRVGNAEVSEAELDETFERALRAGPGAIETLRLTRWAFIVMTPIRLMRPDGTEQHMALAIRGERSIKA